jgi:hypothetical protein
MYLSGLLLEAWKFDCNEPIERFRANEKENTGEKVTLS